MERKTIKFRDHLAKLILAGEKDLTWRLFDDKNLTEGDVVDLVNWNTTEVFAQAELKSVYEKKFSALDEQDFDGHEKFSSEAEMYQTYRNYYGDQVGPDTVVKVVRLQLM